MATQITIVLRKVDNSQIIKKQGASDLPYSGLNLTTMLFRLTDPVFVLQRTQENLQKHIQQKLPEEYQRCLTGMNQVLKLSWQIANNNTKGQDQNDNNNNTPTTGDERTGLQALSLINDCYKYIMDLTTNGVVITDAIKFVHTNKEKLTTIPVSQKADNNEESEERD